MLELFEVESLELVEGGLKSDKVGVDAIGDVDTGTLKLSVSL